MNTLVHVVQHLRPGGIESLVLELERLSPRDDEVVIVSLEGTRSEAMKAWPRLAQHSRHLVFMDKAPGIQPTLSLRLRNVFRRMRPVAIHTHHVGPLLYAGIAARLAGIRCLIHTEHDAWHLAAPKRRALQHLVLRITMPRLVADADFVATALRNYYPQIDPMVIRNGIDLAKFVPACRDSARRILGLPIHCHIVGCAARMHPVKGHRFLVEALHALPADVHLALAGSGEEEVALRRQVTNLALHDRVHFLGQLEDMPRFYQALDLFCLPSLSEGLPLAPLEAQATGVRVVATRTGGVPEAVCPATGEVVEPGNAAALAHGLRTALHRIVDVNPRQFVRQVGDIHETAAQYADLRN